MFIIQEQGNSDLTLSRWIGPRHAVWITFEIFPDCVMTVTTQDLLMLLQDCVLWACLKP